MLILLIIFISTILSCSAPSEKEIHEKYIEAKTHYIKGEMKKSLAVLSEIENHNPKFTQALFLSGKIHFMQNNLQAAEEKWKTAVEIKPYHLSSGKWLLRLYTSEERYDEADKLLFRLFEISPEDPDLMLLGGKLKKDEGKYLEAIEYFEKGFLFEDRFIEAHLDLAEIYNTFGIKEKSIKHLEKAASIGGREHELYKPVKSLISSME